MALSAWLIVGLAYRFPHWWELVLYSATSAVTLLMVFVIQHTQGRQTAAVQRKLDELLRSSRDADSTFIAAEEAPDSDLETLAHLSENDRVHAQEDKLS